MKRLLSLVTITLLSLSIYSQVEHEIIPFTFSSAEVMSLHHIDNALMIETEMNARSSARAPKFAENISVSIDPFSNGTWESHQSGDMIWRMVIESKGAHSLNLGFQTYDLPSGASLIIYNPETYEQAGPFTADDYDEHEELWTPIIEGDLIVLQLIVSQKNKDKVRLNLSHVNHDFINLRSVLSGSCNVDVICGAGDGEELSIIEFYRDIIQSVGLATFNGNAFCTGFLVNNVRQDKTPYYMTADHCNVGPGNAGSIVVYWNYENSTCRPPNSSSSGTGGNGTFAIFNSGAIYRATYAPSDFTLVELDDPVPDDANAFFAGWNRAEELPGDTVICVHHPSLDEKRISFEYGSVHRGNWTTQDANIPNGNHLIVPDWDLGTTEPGSSGAPLFNKAKQIIGQLHGGDAACGNNLYDSYGWFHFSWDGGGTNVSRLSNWLDPDNTNALSIDGLGDAIIISANPNFQKACMPNSFEFSLEIPNAFVNPVNLSTETLPEGATISYSDNPADPGSTVIIEIGNLSSLEANSYTVRILAEDAERTGSSDLAFSVIGEQLRLPNLLVPFDGETDVRLNPNFNWNMLGAIDLTHQIQVATDFDFNNIIFDQSEILGTQITGPNLEIGESYFWRVRSSNLCGPGPWTPAWTFETGDEACINGVADNVPLQIASNGTPTINSTNELESSSIISEIGGVTIDIAHSYIGDLEARLISPSGTILLLFDRPGFPGTEFGCNGSNLQVTFSDIADNNSVDFENACSGSLPSISGEYQPIDALSLLNGEDIDGTWTLRITDNENQDGGQLVSWSLNICSSNNTAFALTLSPSDIVVCENESTNFELTVGDGFESTGVNLSVGDLPDGLFVNLDNDQVDPGGTVTGQVSVIDFPVGDYSFTIVAEDGINTISQTFNVEVKGNPKEVILSEPEDEAVEIDINPIFSWNLDQGVGIYILDIARDADFLDLAYSVDLITPPYNLSDYDLDYEQLYFWRIRALNECGQKISDTQTFTTSSSSSISEIDLQSIAVYPNPTNGLVEIDLMGNTYFDFNIQVLNTTGQLLRSSQSNITRDKIQLDLTHLDNGIYFIQISGKDFRINRKVILVR